MSNYVFETSFNVSCERLVISAYPRETILTYLSRGVTRQLRFVNPEPLSEVTHVFDECDQIRIADLNADGRQWEYGRYSVEVWSEDDPIATFSVDAFEDTE